MRNTPLAIDGAKVLSFCIFNENVRTRENPRCRVSNTENVKGLAICQYQKENEFYLFFCDENWETLNDTLHDDFNEAKETAESIYVGLKDLWQK